jgi:hypothetical protein
MIRKPREMLCCLGWARRPLLACSDPSLSIPDPPRLRRGRAKIARLRAELERQRPGSRRWAGIVMELGRCMTDMEEARRRCHSRAARRICARYRTVLVEDPSLRAACGDAPDGSFDPHGFVRTLRDEAERSGTAVVLTAPLEDGKGGA